MLLISPAQHRWLRLFATSLAALIGLALLSNSRLPDYRDQPFNFYAMKTRELFIVNGLTRRQEGSVKLGFAETYDPPQIGVYGNHIFQFFGGEAFDRPLDPQYFFNFSYANLALPETYRYLLHIERSGRLPRRLILVQITSPNLDNGQFIVNFGYELPPDLLLASGEGSGPVQKAQTLVLYAWRRAESWLHEVLNYGPFILGFLQAAHDARLLDLTNCRVLGSSSPTWLRNAPPFLRDAFGAVRGSDKCDRGLVSAAFRRDGSTDPQYADLTLIQNEDMLSDAERGLKAGDEHDIARQLRTIDAVGRRHGISVVFVLPPAYETDRHDSVVNQIFDRGLALVPDLLVIDDRDMSSDPSLFVDYRHPSPAYFRVLVDQLRSRGLLD